MHIRYRGTQIPCVWLHSVPSEHWGPIWCPDSWASWNLPWASLRPASQPLVPPCPAWCSRTGPRSPEKIQNANNQHKRPDPPKRTQSVRRCLNVIFETRLFPDCGVGGGLQNNQALQTERMKMAVSTFCGIAWGETAASYCMCVARHKTDLLFPPVPLQ